MLIKKSNFCLKSITRNKTNIKFLKRRPLNQEKANPKRENPELETTDYERVGETV